MSETEMDFAVHTCEAEAGGRFSHITGQAAATATKQPPRLIIIMISQPRTYLVRYHEGNISTRGRNFGNSKRRSRIGGTLGYMYNALPASSH